MPYDQFARSLLTATGSDFRSPAANYYRAVSKKDPQTLAESTALLFMGVRPGGARCHAHPTESWTPADLNAMGAFFAQVQYKGTQEWKEEIVYVNPTLTLHDPSTKKLVMPKFLDGPMVDPANVRRPPRAFCQLADRAGQPVLREEHLQSRVVLDYGPRHRQRARRHPPDQSADQSASCWPASRANWSRTSTTCGSSTERF